MSKYKEIFKLKKMLEAEGIPFEFANIFEVMGKGDSRSLDEMKRVCPGLEHYQICYPSREYRWISVVQGLGTYGADADRLEIMGGMKPYDLYKCEGELKVEGYLTAREVFRKIKSHYKGEMYR